MSIPEVKSRGKETSSKEKKGSRKEKISFPLTSGAFTPNFSLSQQ
jgi:hypothetical protein